MADVKWIKIVTDVFDDEKILMIESMPDADAVIVIWFKLLCLAGKQNNSGVFVMGRMPYTDEMFATVFRRPLNTVRMALKTFERFGMIEIINDTVTIPNWDKHQTLDSYEKKKERDRLYQAERRAKQRMIAEKSSDTSSDTSPDQSSYVAISDIDIEEDKDIDIDKERDIGESVPDSAPAQPLSPKAVRHKYGEYRNVLLTDDELSKLKSEFSDYAERIERLSEYIASTGKKYKSHLATIRNWAKRDAEKSGQQNPQKAPAYRRQTKAVELDESYRMMAAWSEE